MSIKKYILHEFKTNLPLFIVFTVLSSLYAFLNAGTYSFAISSTTIVLSSHGIALSFMVVPFIFALIFPLTIFSYRYSRSSTDFYYQIAIDKRFFKRAKAILGLVVLLIVFTLTYLCGSLILLINYFTTSLQEGEKLAEFHFEGLVFSYPFLILTLLTSYAFSFFLGSLGSSNKDKILLFIFGSVLLFLTPGALYFTLVNLFDLSKVGADTTILNPTFLSLSPITSFEFSRYLVTNFCSHGNLNYFGSGVAQISMLVSYLVQIILGVLAFIFTFNREERSGEYALISGAYDIITYLIPHLSFLSVGLYVAFTFYSMGLSSFFILSIFFLFVYYASYYFALVWYYKKLKLPKKDFIALISNSIIVLALAVIFIVLSVVRFGYFS